MKKLLLGITVMTFACSSFAGWVSSPLGGDIDMDGDSEISSGDNGKELFYVYQSGGNDRLGHFYYQNGWQNGDIWISENITEDIAAHPTMKKVFVRTASGYIRDAYYSNGSWNFGTMGWNGSNASGDIAVSGNGVVFYAGSGNSKIYRLKYNYTINDWERTTIASHTNIKNIKVSADGNHCFFHDGNELYDVRSINGQWSKVVLKGAAYNAKFVGDFALNPGSNRIFIMMEDQFDETTYLISVSGQLTGSSWWNEDIVEGERLSMGKLNGKTDDISLVCSPTETYGKVFFADISPSFSSNRTLRNYFWNGGSSAYSSNWRNYAIGPNKVTGQVTIDQSGKVYFTKKSGSKKQIWNSYWVSEAKYATSTNELFEEKTASIFPNPVTGDHISIDGISIDDVTGSQLTLINQQGTIKLSTNDYDPNHVDLSNLEKGLYVIRIRKAGELIFSDKIVIQ